MSECKFNKQRISEQDAREIALNAITCAKTDVSAWLSFLEKWSASDELGTLLAKLNERSEPDYKAQRDELLAAITHLEVSANTIEYCYEHRPENFAMALQRLGCDAKIAREAITKTMASTDVGEQ